MGHSWGSFSTMNIVSLHPEITHVVSMSGFVSVKRMLEQTFAGILKGAVKTMYGLEKKANPDFVDFDAVQSLKNTSAKVLLIASSDDKIVKKEFHFDVLQKELREKENISFLLTEGKGHNPSYTCDAVQYKDAFFAEFQKAVKKKQLETAQQQKEFMARYDWHRMTEQDEAVWQLILQTLQT